MRSPLLITAMLAGVVCMGVVPAKATPQPMPGIAATKAQLAPVEDVGWRRRYRYGYPVPYAYYPPAYGYYYPPPAYRYYAPVYPAYPYYAPYAYRYYRPYYAPY
jgi:hypothetical protein